MALYKQSVKATVNKCVLRLLLKISKLSIHFTLSGRLFHSRGPTTVKGLSPNATQLVLGTTNLGAPSVDLSPYLGGALDTKYPTNDTGAFPLTHLKEIQRLRNIILNLIGSQCSSLRHTVLLSYLDLCRINLAAQFCTRCSLAKVESGKPYNRLQQ